MFVPLFENHHLKKKVSDRAAFALLNFSFASSAELQHLVLPTDPRLPPERELLLHGEVVAPE